MSGTGSQPVVKALTINNNIGADKIIGVSGSGVNGANPDLVIPSMVKRIRISARGATAAFRYSFQSGGIAADDYNVVAATGEYDSKAISTFHRVFVRSDDGTTPKLAVEYWT
jgi:hypothetical protein